MLLNLRAALKKKMAEPNPQPQAEAAAVSAPPPKGGGIFGPIIAAIIIVAGIAGVFKLMVVPALTGEVKEVPADVDDGDGHGEDKGDHGSDSHASGEKMKVPYELDEAILVNIKGENNMVLSAKVGFLLKTKLKEGEDLKAMTDLLDKFKSMLVAQTRGYLVGLEEGDVTDAPEAVHCERLKTKANTVFRNVIKYDPGLKKFLEDDPVEVVFLPSFTHQQ